MEVSQKAQYHLQWSLMKILSPETLLSMVRIQLSSWDLHLHMLTKVKHVPHDSRGAFLFVMYCFSASVSGGLLLVQNLLLRICVITEVHLDEN